MRIAPAWLLTSLLLSAASARADGPHGWVENRGQWDEAVRYRASAAGVELWCTERALVLDTALGQGDSLGFALYLPLAVGDDAAPLEILARERLDSRSSYFLGRDARPFASDVSSWGTLVARDAASGRELTLRVESDGLRYAWSSDAPDLRLDYEGADRIEPLAGGRVEVRLGDRVWIDEPADGEGRRLCWSGRAIAGGSPLLDNPGALGASTFLGGGDTDYGHGLTTDGLGNVYATGYTKSFGFPTTNGAYDRTQGGSYDVCVSKFNSSLTSLIWSTYLGGSAEDRAFAVRLDSAGRVLIGGITYSTDLPVTAGAFDLTMSGDHDAFVAELSANGSALLWCSYLGGNSWDRVWDLEVDATDHPVVVGETYSSDFPTTPGAYQEARVATAEGFLTILDPDGTGLAASSYYGGSDHDQLTSLELASDGSIVAGGNSNSLDMPTTVDAAQGNLAGLNDAIVCRFSPDLHALTYASYLGGSGDDFGDVIALAPNDDLVLTGGTESPDFPCTPGAFDPLWNGARDVFVASLQTSGALAWSTYLGGIASEEAFAVTVDWAGRATVSGETSSTNFPTTGNALDRSYNGAIDAFVTQFESDGHLRWSSFLGGAQFDGGWELYTGPDGNPLLAGPTRSTDFPVTAGSFDTSQNGTVDIFVTRLTIDAVSGLSVPISPPLAALTLLGNPTRDRPTLRFRLANAARVEVTLHDASGRELERWIDAKLPAGEARVERPRELATLARGSYWIRLAVEGASVATRCVVLAPSHAR
ncbi:MAG: SBBP repeat-containing protein [Candidatus Eisenbacteria bacterium]